MIYGPCSLAAHLAFYPTLLKPYLFNRARPSCKSSLINVLWFGIIFIGRRGTWFYLVFVCFYYFLQVSGWLLHSCIILKFIVYLIAFLFFMIMSVSPIRGSWGICFEFLSIATTSRNYLTEL